ncbi:hypothetical protein [Chloroflexus sp. Y-396-1]|uniref:hypothetical protein n=1 Tax=Chloroflexus sp. Y-396-1 TaxID=867845 RepID=UPI00048B5CD4|nr:hypothetical protein [Chloroflexus sp. Y-396-1]
MSAYTPLIDAILRRWWLVVGLALVSALIMSWLAISRLPTYTATAHILAIPSYNLVSETLFETHKQTLVSLATHPLLEGKVIKLLGKSEKTASGELLEQITVSLNGNLIQVSSSATSQEEAMNLVKTWSKEFIAFANEVYTVNQQLGAQLEQELDNARRRYDIAQTNVETFLSQGKLIRAEQEIQRIKRLLEIANIADSEPVARYFQLERELELLILDARTLRDYIMNDQLTSVELENIASIIVLRVRQINEHYNDLLLLTSSQEDETSYNIDWLNQLITNLEKEYQKLQQKTKQIVAPDALGTIQILYDQLAASQAEVERVRAQYSSLLHERDVALGRMNAVSQQIEQLQDITNPPIPFTFHYLGHTVTTADSVLSRRTILTQAAIGALLGASISLVIVFTLELFRFRGREPEQENAP